MTHAPRFISLRIKLGVAATAVLVVLAAALFVAMHNLARERLLVGKEQAARMTGELFLRTAATPVIFDDETGISDTVGRLGKDPAVLAIELRRAEAGHLLGQQLAWSGQRGDTASVPIDWQATPTLERMPDRIVFRGPVRDQDGAIIAVAAIQYSLEAENTALAELRRRLIINAATCAALLGLVLAGLTHRVITGPLSRLLRAVQQVERNEHTDLEAAAGNDEVGRLAEAFRHMADTVERRERDIARRNDEMRRVLDTVAQGLLMIEPDGSMVSERSAIIDRWFGPPPPGALIDDYLRPIDGDAADHLALGLSTIRAGFMPLSVCINQLPRRLRHGERQFACEYRAVASDETLHQLLLVISDITDELEREQTEIEQRDTMAAVTRLVADRTGFLAFQTEVAALIERVAAASQEPASAVQALRDLHTLKGNCGVFGLEGLAARCHAIEERCREDAAPPSTADIEPLRAVWRRLTAKLAGFSGPSRRMIELGVEEYRAFSARVDARAPYPQLRAMVRSWLDDPVLPRLRHLGQHVQWLAQRLGRCPVTLDHGDTGDLRLHGESWQRLWPCLAHMVRNVVDHGLETPEERRAAGKPATARVELSACTDGSGISIIIADDGRGIDWERVRIKSAALDAQNPGGHGGNLIDALFLDGMTTRDRATTTSGRGVGLAAVRHVVDSLGGGITVDGEAGRGTRFILHFPMTRAVYLESESA